MAAVRHTRADVVAHAVTVLDEYGLADLTMRRLGAELDVRPSALYHHFANKQSLLAAVADELLDRTLRPATSQEWSARVTESCTGLRDALLAWRDGAEVVATVHAFGLGGARALAHLDEALDGAGLDPVLRGVAARTLLHYVFGQTTAEQTHLQAVGAGAQVDQTSGAGDAEFAAGLSLVVDGIRARAVVV